MRTRRSIALVSALCAMAFSALAASPAAAEFGLSEFDVYFSEADGSPAAQAGQHPFAMVTNLTANTKPNPIPGGLPAVVPDDEVKDLEIHLPAGFVGNPGATPRCTTEDFVSKQGGDPPDAKSTLCPDATAIGEVAAGVEKPGWYYHAPVYNLVPAPGAAAKFGFVVLGVPVTIDATVNPDAPHNVVAKLNNINQTLLFYTSRFTLWGNPSDPLHDPVRGHCVAIFEQDQSRETPSRPNPATGSGDCPANNPDTAFLTMPRSCTGQMDTVYRAESWQNPGTFVEGSSTSHDNSTPPVPLGMTGCGKLGFGPTISAAPTASSAETASGLDFNLDVEDEGLLKPSGLAQSDIRKAVVALPQGITANPSVAEGLAICTPADYAAERIGLAGCPQAAKIGTVEVETPLLEGELLRGSVFVAQPDDRATATPGQENPFDSLIALYMVIEDPDLGILVKLAGRVAPDASSGRLVTTFDEIPQFPFAHFRFHFRSGGRSPLITPPTCATYTTEAAFTPSAQPTETAAANAEFQIDSGVGGGPCPTGAPPFRPGFEAGSINNNAGSFSPFYMRLTRQDGDQDLTRFSSVLPPGLTGKIAGIAKCPDSAIPTAQAKTGRQELAAPSCPADSKIGATLAGAGVGGELTYVPGSLYLAGPFAGRPLSVIAITPAVAGPFDAGTVVVRQALTLDPNTAQVQVDGSASDPIPHILQGIPLKLRDLRVFVDREDFTLNPTRCDPFQVHATLMGGALDVFSPADDVAVSLTQRYQAANCQALGFAPKLSIRLTGGTKRGDFPGLRGVVEARPGDANIGKAVVTLPRSAFLEQGHIRTICTRVQFAAKACPPGSVYGTARATTPLLDEPLEGPVYLRSSDHELPDLVAALHGVVDVNVVGRIDSIKGRIRSTFEGVPDAPVTKFVLRMQGGQKGLIVNSADLCKGTNRAKARFVGQNGTPRRMRPVVGASCGGKGSGGKQKSRR